MGPYLIIHAILLVAHLVEEFPRVLDPEADTLLHGLHEPEFLGAHVLPRMLHPDLGGCGPEK